MGENADWASRFESLLDRQIRAAQERGEFDDLPGAGKPLPSGPRAAEDRRRAHRGRGRLRR
jgi:hypothetical protein